MFTRSFGPMKPPCSQQAFGPFWSAQSLEKYKSEQPSFRLAALVQPSSSPTTISPFTISSLLTFTFCLSSDVSVTMTNDFWGITLPVDAKAGGPSQINAFASTQVLLLPSGSLCQ